MKREEKNWALRIATLEAEIAKAPIGCPSRREMGKDLDLAWRRYRAAQGLAA